MNMFIGCSRSGREGRGSGVQAGPRTVYSNREDGEVGEVGEGRVRMMDEG